MEPNTLFIKVERLRRLYRSDEHVFTVRRGEDDSFGLGLSEDNEIVTFYHEANSHVLRLGDQIRMVGNTPLVRERLATLLQRQHAGEETVELHISRSTEEPTRKNGNDVFAALQLQTSDGTEIDEWLSELWTLRTDAVWGTFWTLPIVGGSHAAWLGIHESNMFTEPLMGGVLLPLASLQKEKLDCRWYSLCAEDASPGQVCAMHTCMHTHTHMHTYARRTPALARFAPYTHTHPPTHLLSTYRTCSLTYLLAYLPTGTV